MDSGQPVIRSAMGTRVIRVLLIEGDEAAFARLPALLTEVEGSTFDLSCATDWDAGLVRLAGGCIDLALVAERIGDRSGVEFIETAIRRAIDVPMILLTSVESCDISAAAREAGAADYLVMSDLTPSMLSRSIRYVTERAQATQDLRVSEARLRALFHHSSDMIVVSDATGTIQHVNAAIETTLGFRPEAVIGRSGTDLIHVDDLPAVFDALNSVIQQPRKTFVTHYRNQHADGGWRWVESAVTNLLDDPAVGGLVSMSRDISAWVDAEQQLREQASRLQLLAEMSAAFSESALDLDSVLETLARRVSEVLDDICILRLVSDDGRMLVPAAVWHPNPELRTKLRDAQIRPHGVHEWFPGVVMRSGEALLIADFDSDAERLRHPEKGTFLHTHNIYSMLIVPLRVRSEIIGTLAVSRMTPDQPYTVADRDFLQDLADRASQSVDNARLYRRAVETEAQHRQFIEQLPAIIFVEALDDVQGNGIGSTLYISPQVESVFGLTQDEWMRQTDPWIEIVHPDDRPALLAEIGRTNQSGDPFSVEYRAIRPDGSVVWVESESRLVHDGDGQPRFWQGIISDISQRKQAEAALREADDKYRTLVEHSPAVIFTSDIDDESTPLYMSPQIERMLGYPPDAWTSSTIWDRIIHPDDRERVRSLDILTGVSLEPFDTAFRVFASDGRVVWVRNYSVAIRDDDGAPRYWQGYLIDITAQKQAEEAIRFQAQLLETVGQAVVATDTAGHITYWNRAAETLYGWQADEVIGRDILEITPAEQTHKQASEIMQRMTAGDMWSGEFMVRRK
ncbi:MAG: PAS domain S-box protein, partial [Chloroflexota bacterium]|nr:PAS domain S-box protein [Chloroflexota bacterium]